MNEEEKETKKEEFKECDECAAKRGSPTLCLSCLIRRDGLCPHDLHVSRCVPCYEILR